MTNPDTPRPPATLVDRASKLATSTLANALDASGLHNNVIVHIKAVAPGFHFAGPAVTVKETVGAHGDFLSDDFRVGAMIDAASQGDIIAVDCAGAEVSTWGGMASLAAKLKGVAGLLVDGGVRDLEEMIEFDFPVFARHMLPTTGRLRLKVEEINVPVVIDGVTVSPGDIIVADGTGAVCLPTLRAEEVLDVAEKLDRDDRAAVEDLRAGLTFTEAMAKYKGI
ncbi:MAG: RraA family protein [Hyphomicrobiaceae bacterium]|nr:RraA family protein [Hyphomicrobiaceae bacterium]